VLCDDLYVYGDRLDDLRERPQPGWLRRLIGEEYFRDISLIRLDEPKSNIDVLLNSLPIRAIDRVEVLSLEGRPISGAGLAIVGKLRRLRSLTLVASEITDAGLEHLRGLDRLEELSLAYNDITDAGLPHLAGLGRLKRLDISGNRITDAGLARLGAVGRLE